jgi:hypothetical protein
MSKILDGAGSVRLDAKIILTDILFRNSFEREPVNASIPRSHSQVKTKVIYFKFVPR